MENKIELLGFGRFISHHLGGEVYYDSRHKVLKTTCRDGTVLELVKETSDGGETYRDQMIVVNNNGALSVLEYFVK